MLPTRAKYMMAPDWAIRFWQPFCIVKSCLLFLLQIERREVESHLNSAVRHHLDMACVHLVSALGQINDLKAKVEALERREVSRGPRGNSFFWNTKPGSSRELFAHCETLISKIERENVEHIILGNFYLQSFAWLQTRNIWQCRRRIPCHIDCVTEIQWLGSIIPGTRIKIKPNFRVS